MNDWKKEIESVLREIPGYNPWDQAGDSWLDHAAAVRAINWFAENLKHVEGSARGDSFVLKRWQAAIVGNIYGWKRKDESGRVVRRYRKAFIKVARGNGKTPLASGIVLEGLYEDNEPGAQCYLAAGQREQAGFLFRNARGMVEQKPDLLAATDVYGGDQHRSLVLKEDKLSFCKVIPADAAGQHGGIPHITVVDELHVQESRDLLDVFETAMAKKVRSQPLLVMITTSDYDRQSICNEVDDYAHAVRDNGGDPSKPGFDSEFLPVIYEVGKDDDWRDESVWIKANPNLGVSVSLESLRKACKKAEENPAFENAFKRLHLNLKTSQDVALVPMVKWDKCDRTIDIADLIGKRCYAGIDLASTEDLSSLGLWFPLEDDFIAVLSYSWCPEARIIRRARNRVPYDVWAKAGFIEVTSGDLMDYRVIRKKIVELRGSFEIAEIGYDPRFATQLMQELADSDGFTVVPVAQTFRELSAPTKEILRLIGARKLIHNQNPVLRWAASNVAAYYEGKIPVGMKLEDCLDKVPVIPSKRKSPDKIDPYAAMTIAARCAGFHANEENTDEIEVRVI